MTLAHHCCGQVGERCQVAGGANRTLCRDYRQQVVFQHLLQLLYQLPANAGSTAGKRKHFQRHHQAGYGVGKWIADAAAVR